MFSKNNDVSKIYPIYLYFFDTPYNKTLPCIIAIF